MDDYFQFTDPDRSDTGTGIEKAIKGADDPPVPDDDLNGGHAAAWPRPESAVAS